MISGLIRVSSENYLLDLYKWGKIYCNHSEYFKTQDEESGMGDTMEAVDGINQLYDIRVISGKKEVYLADQAQGIINTGKYAGNLFCLFGIRKERLNLKNNKRSTLTWNRQWNGYGSHAVLIYNTQEFLDRVRRALREKSVEHEIAPVEYFFQETHKGFVGPFKKRDTYEWQEEIRVWIPNPKKEPFQFEIGSIEDISMMLKIEEINKVEFGLE